MCKQGTVPIERRDFSVLRIQKKQGLQNTCLHHVGNLHVCDIKVFYRIANEYLKASKIKLFVKYEFSLSASIIPLS